MTTWPEAFAVAAVAISGAAVWCVAIWKDKD